MPIATGTELYNVDALPVMGRGISFSKAELDSALTDPVASILRDDPGKRLLEEATAGLATTEFSRDNLRRAIEATPMIQDWRVGEALGEAYLNQHRVCVFPWPHGRDVRNPNAIPAGADLVGYQETDVPEDAYRFAFGEVKTSTQKSWPPNVMYGRHGMEQQLEKLRDSCEVKNTLFRYMAFHASQGTWRTMFQSSVKRYMQDTCDISLFGVLVRDVAPDEADLRTRVAVLARDCPAPTSIELRAFYLPQACISSLADLAKSKLVKNDNN